MKKAVAILQPLIEADKQEGARSAGKVLMKWNVQAKKI